MPRTHLAVCLLAVSGWLGASLTTGAQDKPRPKSDPPPSGTNNRPPAVHDPSTIVKHKGEYWTFTTGRGVSSLRSKDLIQWEPGPAVFPEPPKWITDVVPTQRGHFWAPDVIHHDGRYLLYYSVSAFGKRTSAIALASTPTLKPDDREYRWKDHGIVIQTDEKS